MIHQLSVGFCLSVPPFESPWLAQDIRSIVRMRWRHAHTNLGAKIDFSLRSWKSKIHKDLNETTVPGNPVTYNLSAFCLLSNWLQLTNWFLPPSFKHLSSGSYCTSRVKLTHVMDRQNKASATNDLILLCDRIHRPDLSGVRYISTSTAWWYPQSTKMGYCKN